MRLIHFADAHLGFESGGRPRPDTGLSTRVHDVLDRLDEIAAFVEAEGADVVLFAGDAFRSARPGPTLETLFAERVRRLAAGGASVVLVAGCHDQPRGPGQRGPLDIYTILEVPGVTVVTQPGVVAAGGGHIACLPWGTPVTDALVTDLAAACTRGEPAVLAAHALVAGASASAAQSQFEAAGPVAVEPATIANPRFAYVALGHVHRHQGDLNAGRRPFVAYAGGLERVDFSEEGEDKGFYVVDLDGDDLARSPEFVPLAARPFLSVSVAMADGEDASAAVERIVAARGAHDDGDAVVRVRVEGSRVALAGLRLPEVIAAFPRAADVRVELRTPRSARPDPIAAREWASEMEALEAWLTAHPDVADADRIRARGRDLIADVVGRAP